MVELCCTHAAPTVEEATLRHCPSCAQRGRPVTLQTVQAQVVISLRELAPGDHHFCATLDCAVVYFAPAMSASSRVAAQRTITRDQLRERVFQKETADEVLVCYCFRYSLGAIRHSDEAGRSAVLAAIVAGTQQGQCACELRNPQGGCCLGNVRRLYTRLEHLVEKA